ncbi:hypothetical protein M413DRAFT_72508, partial [Hebeloma cylindrosporum]
MARFPRDIVEETHVEYDDGHIVMKKLERMLNTFSYPLTYLLRCNTDVTSLLSGTSIKAVISYVTDYITKPTLKTHQILSASYDVYQKKSEMIGADKDTEDAARKLILTIANSLTGKMETGSPFAGLYTLDLPDHYTSHKFPRCWWRNYVTEIMREGSKKERESIDKENTKDINDSDANSDFVLGLEDGKYVLRSYVDDYKFRPAAFEDYTLYKWIQRHQIKKRSPKQIKLFAERLQSGERSPQGRASKFYAFLPEHPLFLTHEAACDEDRSETAAPNFLGGPLPRADEGDREFYCATMLAIYKPWRSAAQLKTPDQT